MPQKTITVNIEVRDDREAEQVQEALQSLIGVGGTLNGATGLLNLYDELKKNVIAKNLVGNIVKRLRRK